MQIMFWFCKWNELILRCFLRLPPHFRLNRNIYLPMSKKYRIFYFLLSEQFFFYLIHFGRTRTLFILFFLFPPFIRSSLCSRLCWLYLSVELFIFVTRYGKNDVCHSWHTSIIQERLFELLLHHCIAHFSVCLRGALCPKMSAATPPLPKSVVLARGAASTVPLLSVRTTEFLLCSFYDLARSESLLCPVPTHTPVHVHRPACFVLPLLEVCTFPIYL